MRTPASSIALALSLACVSPALAQSAADADKFVATAEKELGDFTIFNARVSWINATDLTDDTDAVAARVGQELPLATQYVQLVESCIAHGEGQLDNSVVMQEMRRRRKKMPTRPSENT